MEKKVTKKPLTRTTTAKKTSKKAASFRVKRSVVEETPDTSSLSPLETTAAPMPGESRPIKKTFPWTYIGLAVLVGIIVVLGINRSVFLAAVVNGQPIFRWELNTVLTSRYGQQTVENMVTERLILAEAQKENISINKQAIDARAEQILQSFGSNLSVDEFLKMQGLSRSEFENQLRLQMIIQEILTKDLSLTDDMISQYIASNSGSFMATEPAQIREEARNAIIDEHISGKFQQWLSDIREQANVQTY